LHACKPILITDIITSDNPELDAQVSTSFSLDPCQRLLQDGLQLLPHVHVYRDPVHCSHRLPEWKGFLLCL